MANRTWKCRRVSKGAICGKQNPARIRKCTKCGKTRPPKRYPAHTKVLKEVTYEDYILANGGEFCWIHRQLGIPEQKRTRRLHRDHDHRTGKPRGLLCAPCNRAIKDWMDANWMEAAAAYLRHFT